MFREPAVLPEILNRRPHAIKIVRNKRGGIYARDRLNIRANTLSPLLPQSSV